MGEDKLQYFRMAKELNEEHHSFLLEKELHIRGNVNSFSIISVSQLTPEIGKSGFTSKEKAQNYLSKLEFKRPERKTEEKNLQSYIIKYAMNNMGKLPFGDFTFITSEMAVKLEGNKRIVNDILAVDSKNNLAIIELKSLRDNKVKKQTIDFENKVVLPKSEFIYSLVENLSGKKWNGNIRKIAVWKSPTNKTSIRKNDYESVELYNYHFEGEDNEKYVIMDKVIFSREE
jgi:hypothetical protein